MTTPTPDAVVAAYVKTRDEIAKMTAELSEAIKPLKELQARREQWLTKAILDSGLKNLPTLHGTAYISRAESIQCSDWDTFLKWVIDNEKFEFLERRISKSPVLEMMGENRTELPPPGASYTSIQTLGVRKA